MFYNKVAYFQSGEWEERSFKFDITRFKSKRKYLQFVTEGEGRGVHWAVDEIRACSNNDYRVINERTYYGVECESLKKNFDGKIDTLRLELNSNQGMVVSKCDRNNFKIGKMCYSCNFMSDNPACNGGVICKYENNTTNCACNFGYWGEKCNECKFFNNNRIEQNNSVIVSMTVIFYLKCVHIVKKCHAIGKRALAIPSEENKQKIYNKNLRPKQKS